jgi:protein translocase SecG subunit
MGIALLIVFVISAILLVLIVLVQDDQGEGLGGIFGGGSSTAFGSRSGNILTKVTSVIAAIFFIIAFMFAWINRSMSPELEQERMNIPNEIEVARFEDRILGKIEEEEDKYFILNLYSINNEEQEYILKSDISNIEKEKLSEILDTIGYSFLEEEWIAPVKETEQEDSGPGEW